jgi:hypothetical protein
VSYNSGFDDFAGWINDTANGAPGANGIPLAATSID